MEFTHRIRYELDPEGTTRREFLMRGERILRDTDDLNTETSEVSLEPREVLCFHRATRSIVLRVEVEECPIRLREEGSEVHSIEIFNGMYEYTHYICSTHFRKKISQEERLGEVGSFRGLIFFFDR